MRGGETATTWSSPPTVSWIATILGSVPRGSPPASCEHHRQLVLKALCVLLLLLRGVGLSLELVGLLLQLDLLLVESFGLRLEP